MACLLTRIFCLRPSRPNARRDCATRTGPSVPSVAMFVLSGRVRVLRVGTPELRIHPQNGWSNRCRIEGALIPRRIPRVAGQGGAQAGRDRARINRRGSLRSLNGTTVRQTEPVWIFPCKCGFDEAVAGAFGRIGRDPLIGSRERTFRTTQSEAVSGIGWGRVHSRCNGYPRWINLSLIRLLY